MYSKYLSPHTLWFIIFSLCLSQPVLAIGTHEIAPETLNQKIASGETGLIIDLRDKDKYLQFHIPTAIHVNHTQIKDKITDLVSNKLDTIILYCGDGTRSAIAMITLRKQGFKNVLNVHGNMHAWLRKKLPVSTPQI